MIKRLLSGAIFAVSALGAFADEFNVGDLVYSSDACFRIAGDNLLTNSNFASNLDGWVSINETSLDAVVTVEEGAGPSGEKAVKASSASSDGFYQAIPIETAGTYVLVLQIKGATAGFTQASRSNNAPYASGVNYVNLIFNGDGVPTGATNRVELEIGEGASFGTDGWTTACYPLTITGDEVQGYIIPEIAALAEGVQVTNIELHAATAVFDSRTAQNFKDYCQTIYDGYDWANDPVYEAEMGGKRAKVADFANAISALQSAIDSKDGIEGKVASLQTVLGEFLYENADEMMQYHGTGNGSLSWANWVSKYNAFIGKNSPGGADDDQWANSINQYWRFNTDRWCHKTAAANSDLGIQWMTKSSGDWDNIATATVTLEKGTYFFGFEGIGGRGTANKDDWARSKADKAVYFVSFFNGDTTEVKGLDPALRLRFIQKVDLAEDTEVTFGIRCNNSEPTDLSNWHSVGSTGMFTEFYSPVLYKVYSPEGFTEEQKSYLKNVSVQLEELNNRLETAKADIEEDNSRPWGKNEYKAAYDEFKTLYEEWAALTEDEIIEKYFENDQTLADTIYNKAGKPIKDTYRAAWLKLNLPFSDLADTIKYAQSLYDDDLCENYTDRASLKAAIDAAQSVLDSKLASATSEFVVADSIALREAAHGPIAAANAFLAWLNGDAILDIDFANLAVKNDDETYTIQGAVGQIDFPAGTFVDWTGSEKAEAWDTSKTFVQGWWNGTERENADVLRVGNATATATIDDDKLPTVATANSEIGSDVDIVKVSFDFWFGYLNSANNWFTLLDTDGEVIVNETLGAGTWDDQLSLGDKYNSKGSGTISNVGIYEAAGNQSHFEIILNYGTQTMRATLTNGERGTVTTTNVPMKSAKALKSIQVGSNYSNGDRRSWFDNLRVGVRENGAKVKTVPAPDVTAGDVNGDDAVTMSDANAIVNYYLAEDKSTVTGFNADAADMNGDGDITMSDANAVVNMFLGQE